MDPPAAAAYNTSPLDAEAIAVQSRVPALVRVIQVSPEFVEVWITYDAPDETIAAKESPLTLLVRRLHHEGLDKLLQLSVKTEDSKFFTLSVIYRLLPPEIPSIRTTSPMYNPVMD
jgi:hypothetical protein